MKNYLKSIAVPLAFSAAVFSCKTPAVNIAEYSPVAILSVYSNPNLPWYENKESDSAEQLPKDDGLITGAINRSLNKENPEQTTAQKRLDNAAKKISARMAARGLTVYDSKDLEQNSDEKTFIEYLGNAMPAKGYSVISSANKKTAAAICKKTGAKSVFCFKFKFQKAAKKQGIRNAGVAARVTLSVHATDENGKTIAKRDYTATSKEFAPLSNSLSYDKALLVSLIPDTVDEVISLFLDEYAPLLEGQKEGEVIIEEDEAELTETELQILEEKRATAKRLLDRGMSAEDVADITQLSIDEVLKLK